MHRAPIYDPTSLSSFPFEFHNHKQATVDIATTQSPVKHHHTRMSLLGGNASRNRSDPATQQYTSDSRTSLISSLLPLSLIHQPSANTAAGKERAETSRRMASSATAGLLSRQLKQMKTNLDIPGISCGLVDDNVFEWEVMIMMSDECRFYGGE